ncbi:MAG: CoA transferase [Rhodoferax sp.]|jgi:crotonobetainyl-CoA:carnitine CoA-transferase CaiB-like acyl-CoA transferase|nr:CoA transferase [Rhodoferax sp.]
MNATTPPRTRTTAATPKALKGVRILSLSLNLPGPAALQRCRSMGARCTKLEPPAPSQTDNSGGLTGDPMSGYSRTGYQALQAGLRLLVADLKTAAGQKTLQRELGQADVLMTSFRPSALRKLGLDWPTLQARYPQLSMVAIVGAAGALAEQPGHDLTYVAQAGLVTGLELPASLLADMAGALLASEAVLQAVLLQRQNGWGQRLEVALSDAARHLALPRAWGCMQPDGLLGGGHAGYRLYPCQDGRVALAALEPHFAQSLCAVAAIAWSGFAVMQEAATHRQLASFVASRTCAELDALAAAHDIPLHTILNK